MDGVVVAWIGVGLTVAVQAVGIGVFVGTISTRVRSLHRDLLTHIDRPVPQGHGCPYFDPRLSSHSEP